MSGFAILRGTTIANPNIFAQYAQPVRTVADYTNEAERGEYLQGQNAIQRATLLDRQNAQRVSAEQQNALTNLLSGANGEDDVINRLLGSGNPGLITQGSALDLARQKRVKEKADIGKVGADTAKVTGETADAALKRYQGMLPYIDTPQAAARWLQAQYNDPAAGQILNGIRPFEEAVTSIPSDPQQFQQWRTQAGIGMEKVAQFAKERELAKLQSDTSIATNAATNATSRANNAATNATSRANTASNNAVSMRGQNLTNDRAVDLNATTREIGLETKKLALDKAQSEADARRISKEAGISSAGNQIAVIDKALSHPGRETATGLSGSVDPRNYVPGTDASDFRAVLDQIGGAAFLQAFESLKGGGQITEVEGKKATDAIARLNRAQSDSEFKSSLNDLREVMTTGYKRLSGKDYSKPTSVSGTVGQTATNPKTGEKLQLVNGQWVPAK